MPVLRNEPTPEANGYGVGSTRLELRQQMANMRLDRLLGEEQALADLAVHEAVGDQLEHLDLTRRRLLLELAQGRRGVNGITDPVRFEFRRAAAASNRRLWSR